MLAKSEDVEIAENGKISVKLTSASSKADTTYRKTGNIGSIFWRPTQKRHQPKASQRRKAWQKMRVLIDTCVVIDAISGREPFSESAQQILLMAERGYLDGFITANQLTDLHYLIHRETHNNSLANDILKQLIKPL